MRKQKVKELEKSQKEATLSGRRGTENWKKKTSKQNIRKPDVHLPLLQELLVLPLKLPKV
jgi:hypothetical protein